MRYSLAYLVLRFLELRHGEVKSIWAAEKGTGKVKKYRGGTVSFAGKIRALSAIKMKIYRACRNMRVFMGIGDHLCLLKRLPVTGD